MDTDRWENLDGIQGEQLPSFNGRSRVTDRWEGTTYADPGHQNDVSQYTASVLQRWTPSTSIIMLCSHDRPRCLRHGPSRPVTLVNKPSQPMSHSNLLYYPLGPLLRRLETTRSPGGRELQIHLNVSMNRGPCDRFEVTERMRPHFPLKAPSP